MTTQRASIFLSLLGLMAVFGPRLMPDQEPAGSSSVIRTESRVVLVDAVVTDRKGHYVRDLKQKDFRIWEDNKEQTINSFTFEADPASPANDRKHYVVLFFDNSSAAPSDQIRARQAAVKFIDANKGPNRLMSIVEFSGGLHVSQNFTDDADSLKNVVNGVKFSSQPTNRGPAVLRSFAARNVLIALRDLAKGLTSVQGRKTLVFISGGFPLDEEGLNELRSTIDACNRANVAVYPIDVRGLMAPPPGGGRRASLYNRGGLIQPAAFQKRGGSSGGSNPLNPGGGGRGGRGNMGEIAPTISSINTNQQVLYSLASGTGGFPIVNANDLFAGFEKIGKEQDEYYLIGYSPSKELEPGACHTIKVKVDQSGLNVRARSGYCDVKPKDILAGTPTERDLENRVNGGAAATVKASMQAPFVYSAPGIARVNVAMEIPADALAFNKEKGRFRMALNIIGIVYLPDGGVAARFSDTVKRDYEDKKEVESFQRRTFHYDKQFEVASGKYTLKVAFSSGAESFGKLELPLVVEPYENNQFMVSGLVLSKDAHSVDSGTLGADAVMMEDHVPFVVSGIEISPAATNRFKKTERGFVYGELYEPEYMAEKIKDPFAVGVQMQIVDKKSDAVKVDTGLVRLNPKPQSGVPTVPFGLKLDFTNLTPGSYRLLIMGIDSDGRKFTRGTDFEMEQ
jgi:VWFA-related protein